MATVLPNHPSNGSSQGEKQGALVLILGPSGSGKDTLISWLHSRLTGDDRILFVKRTVTRSAVGDSEDHYCIDEPTFITARDSGDFAVTWTAHGQHYALPNLALDHVKQGGLAIANGARRALNHIEAVFEQVVIIRLIVDPTILQERLVNRGRESAADIKTRLNDAALPLVTHLPVIEIENSGAIDKAGEAAMVAINQFLKAFCDK